MEDKYVVWFVENIDNLSGLINLELDFQRNDLEY